MAGHVQDLESAAAASPCRHQVVGLAVVLRALVAADGEEQRARRRPRQQHRAVAPRGVRRQRQHVVEVAEPDRLEIVEPADGAAALDDVGRRPQRCPVGGEQHGDQVAAGRVPGDEDPPRVAAELAGVAVDPDDRRATLGHQRVQVDARHPAVVRDDGDRARRPQPAHDEAEVRLVEAVPVAAVKEHVNGSHRGRGGAEHVEPLGVMDAVRHVEAHRQLRAGPRARGAVAGDPLHRALDLRAVVVLRVERGAVVTAEHGRGHDGPPDLRQRLAVCKRPAAGTSSEELAT